MLVSQVLIEKNPLRILKYLKIGISIPILPEFQKYIIKTFKNYKVKALFLIENGIPTGMTILFNENRERLFFGYFFILFEQVPKSFFGKIRNGGLSVNA